MAKSFKIIIWAVLCIMVAGCYHQRYDKTYRIQPNSHNGGLTITNRFLDTMMMYSFSNDSIEDGGYITFKRLLRDEFPIDVYYVAPDSIFVTNGKIIDFKSQGFNIFNVKEVFEPSNEYETYTITEYGRTLERRYPTYYIISTPTDTLRVERVSFIHDYTYYIEIHNDDITVWNAERELIMK